jgi:hypothetical protein
VVKPVRAAVVDALEIACGATRLLEWVPGWHRLYRQCQLARWSSQLDHRWGTGRWPTHDADGHDAWEEWFDNLPESDLAKAHWHHW